MILGTIEEAVGNTPLVEISNRLNDGGARVLAKVESFNPGGSAKDRVAVAMIDAAEREGVLKPGMTIVEPTSGNTGVGLSLVSAIRGYKMVLTMPDTMSVERIRLAKAYGAEVVLTPGAEGMKGAIAAAERIRDERGAFIPQQFENPANAAAHELTTGPEIWRDTEGKVDAFVAGVGTGGTITGVGRYLRKMNPAVGIYAVEPIESQVLAGKSAAPHRLQGIGANFVPKVTDVSLFTEIIPVTAEDAGKAARDAAAKAGMLVGISSGAALHAALTLSRRPDFAGRTIVVLLPDTGERYLSTWLFE